MSTARQSLSPAAVFNNALAGRLHYLDWLRLGAVVAVFLLHCAKIFDYHTTDLFNGQRSAILSAGREVALLFVMPLFFAISGAAAFIALRRQTAGAFILSKLRRLLLPLLLVGTFLVNPVYVYAIRLFQGQATENFFAWYPSFFQGWWGFGGNFAPAGNGTHLWYLEFLFLYLLLLLPLFRIPRRPGASLLQRLSLNLQSPLALTLLFLPVSVSAALFEASGLGGVRMMGGWDPISYLMFLALGYLVFCNPTLRENLRRHGLFYLAAALLGTALYVDSHFGFHLDLPGITRHNLAGGAAAPLNQTAWVAVQALRAPLAWFWVLGLVGFGMRFLNSDNRFLARANPVVLPFYMLHHSVILLFGCLIVPWNLGPLAKFGLIAGFSLAVILVLCQYAVRRWNFTRLLFGMKTRQPLDTLPHARPEVPQSRWNVFF